MPVSDIHWPMDGQRQRHTLATDTVLDLCKDLIERFRFQRAPMPLVVLQAQDPDPDGRVAEIVDVLHEVFRDGRLLCQRFGIVGPAASHQPGLSPDAQHYHRALEMARRLADPTAWDNEDRCQYKPYSFPRSAILAAIEDAAGAAETAPTPSGVLDRLGQRRWRRGRQPSATPRRVFAPLVSPSTLIGALVLAGASQALAQAALPVLLGFLLGGLVLLVIAQVIYQHRAPLAWLGSASHWFATTTFLAPTPLRPPGRSRHWPRLGPRRSWRVTQARARLVAEQLILARYGGKDPQADPAAVKRALQFCLQLRVLALLEDLRAGHRRWAADMRGSKRTCPPMVFLPNADYDNGGLTLLAAISDVRSRRSEIDPLLVLASVPQGENIEQSQLEAVSSGPHQEAGQDFYVAWSRQMRVGQSPSLGSTWPWMMRLPLRGDRLVDQGSDKRQPRATRSPWLLWSRWTLAAAVLALAVTGLVRNYDLAHIYCGGGLIRSNHDLVFSPQSPGQCVGMDTNGSGVFTPPGGGVPLNGAVPGSPGLSNLGKGITLAKLEHLINKQNAAADGTRHVTVVYAGPLTSASTSTGKDELQALRGVKELAGVYAWQTEVNSNLLPKMRVDIANGGQDMTSEVVMARKIVAAARQDPTIDGVVGMGHDTSQTSEAVQILGSAGLTLVDTTNSSSVLRPHHWNYLGLSATNVEEANSLARYALRAENRTAIVFTRAGSDDPYTSEQSQAAQSMLRKDGFRLVGNHPVTYTVSSNGASFGATTGQVCGGPRASVIYLAGRFGDLSGLMGLLRGNVNCFAPHVIVLSGDDLTKNELFDPTQVKIPSNVTVYYTAQTDVPGTGLASSLALDTQKAFDLPSMPLYSDAYFEDGSVALAFDAADALYTAAATAQNRYAVRGILQCTHITGGATGQIWFNGVHHGVAIVEVASGNSHIVHDSPTTGISCPRQ